MESAWAPLENEEVLFRQGKWGELRWLATASRPDMCARQAILAAEVTHLQGYAVCRTNGIMRTPRQSQERAILKSSSKRGIYQMCMKGWSGAVFLGTSVKMGQVPEETRLVYCPSP